MHHVAMKKYFCVSAAANLKSKQFQTAETKDFSDGS